MHRPYGIWGRVAGRVAAAALVFAAIAWGTSGCGGDPSTRFARLPDGSFNEGAGRIELTWNPVDNPDLGGYFVYIGKRRGGKKVKVNMEPMPKTAYTITGLSVGERYFFAISTASRGTAIVESPKTAEFEMVATAPK